MIYRKHPGTGDELSAVGFGGMRFPAEDEREDCARLLLAAYRAGINYFDTASGYGDGRSEEIFGLAFKEMRKTRDERPFYVSTKSSAAAPDKLRRDLETSLTRMGLDYIDYYHCWCIITLDAWRKRKTVLKEFEKLRDEGLIRHIAVSTHLRGDEIGDLLDDYPFKSVLLGYSAMNFMFRRQGLEAAARRGVGVVVMNPLGGGLIPQNPERFSFLRDPGDPGVVQGALRFLFSDPRISVSLVGMENESHLQDALLALKGFSPWPPARIERVRQELSESFDAMCTGCAYCDHCPEGLPVPKLMEAYNHYLFNGEPRHLLDRLRWHWGLPQAPELYRTCRECGACEQACTQHLPIIERIREIARMAADAREKQG